LSDKHRYQDLIVLFDQCFHDYNTRLVKGDDEPIYLPADKYRPYNALQFAHGFYSSALHEISHWLIAGKTRRQHIDFNYWYKPRGRTRQDQLLFQKMECKPQALEWILSKAAGYKFIVSLDNLTETGIDTQPFKQAIYDQVQTYCQQGLGKRAQQFHQSLTRFYNTATNLQDYYFSVDEL